VVLISPAHGNFRRELSGAEEMSTNNRMEMTAAIRGLAALKSPANVFLHTDSRNLMQAFTEGWLVKWQSNGWRTAGRSPVLNKDLWIELSRLVSMHDVQWVWVKGHDSDVENNRADALAVQARELRAEQLKN